jgi:hypothetical protein
MVSQEQNQRAPWTLEQRREPRIKAGQTALLMTASDLPMEAWVLDVASRGVRLRVSASVPVGAAVRIEAQEMMLFGTIAHCELNRGAYEVGIALSQPLEMLGELSKLYTALLAGSQSA